MSAAPAPGPDGPDDDHDDPALRRTGADAPGRGADAHRARVAPIASVLALVVTLVNRGAFEDAAEHYTRDAVLFDARGATYLGRGGAVSLLSQPNACGVGRVEVRLHRAEVVDATAVAVGAFTLHPDPPADGGVAAHETAAPRRMPVAPSGPTERGGRRLSMDGGLELDLRREHDAWRIVRQVVRIGE